VGGYRRNAWVVIAEIRNFCGEDEICPPAAATSRYVREQSAGKRGGTRHSLRIGTPLQERAPDGAPTRKVPHFRAALTC